MAVAERWFKVRMTSGDKLGWYASKDIVGRFDVVAEDAAGHFSEREVQAVRIHLIKQFGYKSEVIEVKAS
jgi:hypothetical protein